MIYQQMNSRFSNLIFNQKSITAEEFTQICDLVYRKSGIILTEKKKSLVVGRLGKILLQNGFSSFGEYFTWVNSDRTGRALNSLLDRISTNHTYFYRENEHFDFIRNMILPEYLERNKNQDSGEYRIWCAGCSTGEEAYVVAMLMMDAKKNMMKEWNVRILGTDISRAALSVAESGIYSEDNIGRLPAHLRSDYFDKLKDGKYAVKSRVKDIILFRRLNLVRESYPFKRKFNIILCRNVMIYFDDQTRAAITDRFYDYTEPGGYLFTGHSESLNRTKTRYSYIQPAIYKRN